jgi:hypothetical protein
MPAVTAETIVALAAIAAALLFIAVVAVRLRLAAAGDEGRQAALIRLRVGVVGRLRLILRLRTMLLNRLHRLAAGVRLRVRIARCFFALAVVVAVHVGSLIGRLRLVGILLRVLRLRRRDQTEIVFGVLQITFGGYRVARGLRVARELNIFFGDVVGGAADLHIRAVRFVDAGERVVAAIIVVPVAPAHPLLLIVVVSVSHCLTSLG